MGRALPRDHHHNRSCLAGADAVREPGCRRDGFGLSGRDRGTSNNEGCVAVNGVPETGAGDDGIATVTGTCGSASGIGLSLIFSRSRVVTGSAAVAVVRWG